MWLKIEPRSRERQTLMCCWNILFSIARFEDFSELMAEIFIRHCVNVLNISIRHAIADSGSLLAWAREEVFAFVVYYKQRTDAVERNRVAVWTRELADAVISVGGCYYLPYQLHPT